MTLAAGLVRVPGANRFGESQARAADVPELVVTRMDWLPVGGEARERLRLLDPTPLFMPGTRVSDARPNPEGLADRPSGAAGEAIPAALLFSHDHPTRDILRPSPPATPLEGVDVVSGSRWFEGMARTDPRPSGAADNPPTPGGSGRMDVYRIGEAERIGTVALPPDPMLDAAAWQPLEMSVLIRAGGAVAAPAVTAGSGVGELDERVRTLVARELLPRLLLRPGAYRLVVGP